MRMSMQRACAIGRWIDSGEAQPQVERSGAMNIRRPRFSFVWQMLLAIILGVGATIAVEHAGPQVTTGVLAVLLVACMFVLLGLARA
ncbi:MAG: hypothetical protein ACXVA4_14200, partial [Ktedonobacterales bacterium]